ncbi:MAG: helix-turn-helix transcriptional regulator [Firmicutes bacterium]|nr:helix-turn-helix transcriptional regulator [Bacillota bacterium]
MNKYVAKIDKLRAERGMSLYKLAQESGIYPQTLHKWFGKDVIPSLPAVEKVCEVFQMTLSDFFAEDNTIELTKEKQELYDSWCALSSSEKEAVRAIVRSFRQKK